MINNLRTPKEWRLSVCNDVPPAKKDGRNGGSYAVIEQNAMTPGTVVYAVGKREHYILCKLCCIDRVLCNTQK